MARKPDTPCSSCGRLLWSGRGSRPGELRVCRPCRRQAAAKKSPGQHYLPQLCPSCQKAFLPTGHKQVTCSLTCGQKWRHRAVDEETRRARERERWQQKSRRRRALKYSMPSEPYTLTEIAFRDGHRCQLCHRKVNMLLQAPHPRSATVDHVVPFAEGGDDTRANVQLAHWGCNSRKGAGGGPWQMALIG